MARTFGVGSEKTKGKQPRVRGALVVTYDAHEGLHDDGLHTKGLHLGVGRVCFAPEAVRDTTTFV